MTRMPIALLLPLVLLAGCATIKPTATVSPTYSSISANILSASCIHCHGFMGGYNFSSYANTLKAVDAGNPDSSPLYLSLSSGKMPKLGSHPSAQQIQAVREWIEAGALDN
ncbi:MAG: hypothetical protein WCQ50_04830 [Spirochaetota bacterium]